MAQPTPCLIALGSNLGDRQQYLQNTVAALHSEPAIENLVVSRWHATNPVGGPTGQGEFLNGAACLQTHLGPSELLDLLHQTENRIGRQRAIRWEARVVDLDLLLYGHEICGSATGETHNASKVPLRIPHPRMAMRRFVLQPAAEIAPEMLHPEIGWTVAQLLTHLQDWPAYLAISSNNRMRSKTISDAVSDAVGGRRLSFQQPANITAAQLPDYFRACAQQHPDTKSWPANKWHIADAHPADILLQYSDGVAAEQIALANTKSIRAKLRVHDNVSQIYGHEGPLLDISNLPSDIAIAEITAALQAMS